MLTLNMLTLLIKIKIKMVMPEMAMLSKVIFYISYISILLPPPTEAVYCKQYLTCLPTVWLILFLLRNQTSMDLV